MYVGLVVVAEDRALLRRERDDQAHALAVLGHVGEPEPPHGPRRGGAAASARSRPFQRICPDFAGADARERLEQLRLAVAGDAGDADDLARAAP